MISLWTQQFPRITRVASKYLLGASVFLPHKQSRRSALHSLVLIKVLPTGESPADINFYVFQLNRMKKVVYKDTLLLSRKLL